MSQTSGYRPEILVVDDESAIADTLAKILNLRGYAAYATYDGKSALEVALLRPPEMLITDVVLPGMNGIELAVSIKRVYPECKVLLFSGQASTTDLMVGADREGHHFNLLTKPVPPEHLLAIVAEELKDNRKRHALCAGS